MRKFPKVSWLGVLLPTLLLSGCSLPSILANHLSPAALTVTANPKAEVFLDGKSIGQTPITKKALTATNYTISLKAGAATWADQIQIFPSTVTTINRELSADPAGGSGEVVQLEEGSGITVIGTPKDASVALDNKAVGTIPVSLGSIGKETHDLSVSHEGYTDRSLAIQDTPGYKTIFNIELAQIGNTSTPSSASPTPAATTGSTTSPKPISTPSTVGATTAPTAAPTSQSTGNGSATIGDTGYGWLRVHTSPGGAEAFRVNTGDTVTVLKTSGSWIQIQTSDGQSGWVASQYVNK